MNKLYEYLEKSGIKHYVFAKKIGTTTTTMHKILKKGLTPTLKLAFKIQKETKGIIKAEDWLLTKAPKKDKKSHDNEKDETTKDQ